MMLLPPAHLNRMACALALIGLSATAWADSDFSPIADTSAELPTVSVSADRLLPNPQIYSVSGRDINRRHAVDLKQALKDVPSVQVSAVLNMRQGNDSVNIRGLNQNRVAMDVDDVPTPEGQEFKIWTSQGLLFGRGMFNDNSGLSSISIDKSSQGNAIGGSVSMHTLTPDEVLAGETLGGYLNTAYNSVDRSMMYSGAAAIEQGNYKGMLLATYRKGHEVETQGKSGEILHIDRKARKIVVYDKANPLDYNSRYFLSKHELALNPQHTLGITAEYLDRNQWINHKDELNNYGRSSVDSWFSNDRINRARLSLTHRYHDASHPYAQEVRNHLYWQKAETHAQMHARGTNEFDSDNYLKPGFRDQGSKTGDTVLGFKSEAQSHFAFPSWQSDWRYGISAAHHSLTSDWNSNYVYIQSGLGMGDGNISKPFADAKRWNLSLFADGDWKLGQLTLSTGLSAHHYRLSPSLNNYRSPEEEQGGASRLSATRLTPRLGIAYEVSPLFEPYFRYSRGFKAPTTQQITNAFDAGMYAMIGNPKLKPETGNNFEIGIRGANSNIEYGIAAYDNRYRDFIDFTSIPSPRYMLVQFNNATKARIYGAEAYGSWKFADHWRLSGNIAYARGKKQVITKNGTEWAALNEVSPLKTNLNLAYERERWGANLGLTHEHRKNNKDVYSTNPKYRFNPHISYTLVDIGAYWKPVKNLQLTAGINNLFDKKYWDWGNLAYQIPTMDNEYDGNVKLSKDTVDRYTAPGRNFNIGLRYTF